MGINTVSQAGEAEVKAREALNRFRNAIAEAGTARRLLEELKSVRQEGRLGTSELYLVSLRVARDSSGGSPKAGYALQEDDHAILEIAISRMEAVVEKLEKEVDDFVFRFGKL